MRIDQILLLLLIGAATPAAGAPTCRIDPGLVRPWRDFHRLRQTRPPYALEYRGCGKSLVYVAAAHSNEPESATFRLVRAVFAQRPIDFAIVEGFPDGFGTSPVRMIEYARQTQDTREDGEDLLAVRLAVASGAGFSGGEPMDADVLRAVTSSGMSAADLFGFYVLRQIEQWEREGRISGPGDPGLAKQIELVAAEFETNTGVPVADLSAVATLDGWMSWYRAANGVGYEQGYRHEDAYPSGANTRATNRMSDEVNDARDRYVISVIARALRTHDTVLVVYGASHNVVETPALEAAYGAPKRLNEHSSRSARSR